MIAYKYKYNKYKNTKCLKFKIYIKYHIDVTTYKIVHFVLRCVRVFFYSYLVDHCFPPLSLIAYIYTQLAIS